MTGKIPLDCINLSNREECCNVCLSGEPPEGYFDEDEQFTYEYCCNHSSTSLREAYYALPVEKRWGS